MSFFAGAMPDAISQGILWAVMVLGVYITFKILDIADLTVDGSFSLGGCTCAALMYNGMNPVLALFIGFLAGLLAGAVTGILHTVFEIPAILAGILTQISIWPINLKIMGRANTPLMKTADKKKIKSIFLLVSEKFGIDQSTATLIVGLVIVIVLIIFLYWFFGTELGCSLRATGCNPNMSRAQGINTNRNKVLGLMISNGLVGLCGALYGQFQGASDVNMGRGAIVIGLAAVIIGEVLFGKFASKRKLAFAFTLASVILGAVIYYMVYQFVLWLKMPSEDMKLFSAIVVAIFLAIPYLKEKRTLRKGASK